MFSYLSDKLGPGCVGPTFPVSSPTGYEKAKSSLNCQKTGPPGFLLSPCPLWKWE